MDDESLMTKDQGPATKDQEPWPWPMAMAQRVAATLRVKHKIDFIFDLKGGAPPLRLKYMTPACDPKQWVLGDLDDVTWTRVILAV